MRKKPPIRYVDMAIYIDNNINKPNADIEKIYEYLKMLAYMLSVKRRFFNSEHYYDLFSDYMACIVYTRMTTKKENLTPIKSCLNYMKQIIYGRKCAFCAEEFDYTSQTAEDSEILKLFNKQRVASSNSGLLTIEVNDYFNSITKIIWDELNKIPYKNDKVLIWKLYTSCLLTLLRTFTLSNKNKQHLLKRHSDIMLKDDYEFLLTSFMLEETKNAPVAYDLEPVWVDYVAVIVQKIKSRLINDINELSKSYDFSDDLVEDVLMSSMPISQEDL